MAANGVTDKKDTKVPKVQPEGENKVKLFDVKTEMISILTNVISSFFSRKLLLNETANKALMGSLFALTLSGISYVSTKNPVGYILSTTNKLIFGNRKCKIIKNKEIINDLIRYLEINDRYIDIPIKDAKSKENLNKEIQFNDISHGVNGTIKFSVNKNTPQITIMYELFGDTIDNYLGKIHNSIIGKDIEEKLKRDSVNLITLYDVTQCKDRKITEVMYRNNKIEPIILESIFMKTIFHKDIEFLWTQIKSIHFNPEELWANGIAPRMNLLLHGPPGTGKSTFAYRVAMATGRHIVNIKLCEHTKDTLMQVFKSPCISSKHLYSKEVLFVLDEFDLDLERILIKSACQKKHLKKIDAIVGKFFDGLVDNIITTREPHPQKHVSEKNKSEKNEGTVDVQQKCDELEENKPKSDEKQIERQCDVINSAEDIKREIDKFDNYVSAMNSTYEKLDESTSDIIKIEDLLTIFQGAIPIEGCIIIAMTNKFDEIYKKCPALFRPGRLTPVRFGHFDMTILNQVSMHYFNKEITYDCSSETEMNIPPSQVMEIVASSILQKSEKYKYFVNRLQKLLSPSINIHEVCDNTYCSESDYIHARKTNFSLYKYDEPNIVAVIDNCGTADPKQKQRQKRSGTIYVHSELHWKSYHLCNDPKYEWNKTIHDECVYEGKTKEAIKIYGCSFCASSNGIYTISKSNPAFEFGIPASVDPKNELYSVTVTEK